ncbi:uncharacterized protein LOC132615067 [Lycium barbarum]|uniref:uncharacterized protein LOC132615067 n=1 Tax=Lycium barbarum TaxID=112863 RepID=UPI00293F06CF|nr:uncharacterized protein LOC132615067 [Lycium barbarum]
MMLESTSLIANDESSRNVNVASTNNFNSVASSSNFRTHYGGIGQSQYGNFGASSSSGSGGGKPPNISNLFCEFCKRHGHTRDRCYKLHGFPQKFKFTKGKNSGSTANVHETLEEMSGRKHDDSNHTQHHDQKTLNLSKKQYDQLLSLLDHIHIQGGNRTGNSTKEVVNDIIGGAVNFAGPFNEEPIGDW